VAGTVEAGEGSVGESPHPGEIPLQLFYVSMINRSKTEVKYVMSFVLIIKPI
jgi:hypothetical protein